MEENKKNSRQESADLKEQACLDKLESLIKEGQKKGSLSSKELSIIDSMNLDPEKIDKFYERLEALGVETTDEEALELLEDVDAIERELVLVKIRNNPDNHQRVLSALEIFKAKIINYSVEALCIEVTGTPDKIDALIEMIKPLGIIELCRTGIVALQKGGGSILESEDVN